MGTDHVSPDTLTQLPQGQFLLSAHFGDFRTGLLTSWVAPCSDEPVLLTVSIPRGSLVEPLIRDSRAFTLARVAADDRVLQRRFTSELLRADDPFVGLDMQTLPNGGLAPACCTSWLECTLAGHLAPDSGHRVYLGLIVAASDLVKPKRKRSA